MINHTQFKSWHAGENKSSVPDRQMEEGRDIQRDPKLKFNPCFHMRFLSKFIMVLFSVYMHLGTIFSHELAHSNSALPDFPGLFLIPK